MSARRDHGLLRSRTTLLACLLSMYPLSGCAEVVVGIEAAKRVSRALNPDVPARDGIPRIDGIQLAQAQTGTQTDAQTALVSPYLEPAPQIFEATGRAIWDGKRTLQGVWVAHPLATTARRVRIFNTANGRAVDGALFKRDAALGGASVLISSEAAVRLGMTAGSAADLRIVAVTPVPQDTAKPTPAQEVADDQTATPVQNETVQATEQETTQAETAATPEIQEAPKPQAKPEAQPAAEAPVEQAEATPAAPEKPEPADEAEAGAAAKPEAEPEAEAEAASATDQPAGTANDDQQTAAADPSDTEEAATFKWDRASDTQAETTALVQTEQPKPKPELAEKPEPAQIQTAQAEEPEPEPAPLQPVEVKPQPPADPAPQAQPETQPQAQTQTASNASPLRLPFVQAGVFGVASNATKLVNRLKAKGIPAQGRKIRSGGRTLTKVLAGPFQTTAERSAAQRTIRQMGMKDAVPVRR